VEATRSPSRLDGPTEARVCAPVNGSKASGTSGKHVTQGEGMCYVRFIGTLSAAV
jgi:hypothetical protein